MQGPNGSLSSSRWCGQFDRRSWLSTRPIASTSGAGIFARSLVGSKFERLASSSAFHDGHRGGDATADLDVLGSEQRASFRPQCGSTQHLPAALASVAAGAAPDRRPVVPLPSAARREGDRLHANPQNLGSVAATPSRSGLGDSNFPFPDCIGEGVGNRGVVENSKWHSLFTTERSRQPVSG